MQFDDPRIERIGYTVGSRKFIEVFRDCLVYQTSFQMALYKNPRVLYQFGNKRFIRALYCKNTSLFIRSFFDFVDRNVRGPDFFCGESPDNFPAAKKNMCIR